MSVNTRKGAPWLLGLGLGLAAAAVVAVVVGGGGSGGAATSASAGSATPAARGPAVPTNEFEFFDGSTATLAHYEGQPLVINFWASWCPSCVAEMSAALRPVQELRGDEVSFVGFNIQDDRRRALSLVEETGVLFDLADDPRGDLYTELGGIGMPFTVFVSADGEITHKHNGPVTEGQLDDLINEHLTGT